MGIILGGRRGGTRSAAEGRRSCAGEQLPDHRVPPFLPRLPPALAPSPSCARNQAAPGRAN